MTTIPTRGAVARMSSPAHQRAAAHSVRALARQSTSDRPHATPSDKLKRYTPTTPRQRPVSQWMLRGNRVFAPRPSRGTRNMKTTEPCRLTN
eukprot:scaffold41923_cov57-Phaeocystis_antarctica.AAC.1